VSGWKAVLELLGKASARIFFACPNWVPHRLRLLPCSFCVLLVRLTCREEIRRGRSAAKGGGAATNKRSETEPALGYPELPGNPTNAGKASPSSNALPCAP
jgi:hypothetical protein